MSQKSTSLNPSASEFVPNFAMPNMNNLSLNDSTPSETEQTYQQQGTQQYHHQNNNNNNYYNNQQEYHSNQRNQQPQQQFYGQNYNTSHRHSYNPNYRGNNYRPNYRHNQNNNYYGNNNGYNNYYGNNNYNNHHQQQQNYDVDSFELEARCDAVIEILQDDKIRDQLNPNSEEGVAEPVPSQQQLNNKSNTNNPEPELDDEEEMAEMMAMQEECRLEMMKFYIQSQNPALFESIYHDVSYPEAAAAKQKVPEEELRSPKVMPIKTEETSAEDVQVEVNNNTLKDLIINELNPDVPEFVPNKFSNEAESESFQTN